MISLSSRTFDSASPWMIVISVLFHGLVAVAVVVVSSAALKARKPPEEIVRHVKLIEPAAGTLVAEKLQPPPQETVEVLPSAEPAIPPEPAKSSEPERETIQVNSMAPPSQELIPMAKRRSPPKRLAAPKEEPKKEEPKPKTADEKKEKAKPAPKESPESFLQKRLAAIRKNLENKKQEESPVRGSYGSKPGSGTTDEEIARWLEQVKSAINAHWAVFGHDRRQDRITVIGARIADDGKLTAAAVDQSSGDPVFDRSAMRAVYQASPFPAIPTSAREKIRKEGGLALRFTPGGMQ